MACSSKGPEVVEILKINGDRKRINDEHADD